MMQAPKHQQGFTLIEVLVALALMAVLSILSWQALDVTTRSSERLNASADDTLSLIRVLGQHESDIRRHAGDDNLSNPSASTSKGVKLPAGIHWDGARLNVVRSAHDGTWKQVSWRQDGPGLFRAEGGSSPTLPLPAPDAEAVMLQQIRSFTVRAWIPGLGWSALNATDSPLPATGLEVLIEREHHGVSETYRKVVLLP
jgi:general secretion pathway protein J